MPKSHCPKSKRQLRATLISTAIKSLLTGSPLLFGLTAMEKIHADVTLPSSASQIVLQSYTGQNVFDSPASTTLSAGITSDNSKDWTITNEGTITAYNGSPTIQLGSATGASSVTNSGIISNTVTGSAGSGVQVLQGGTVTNKATGTISAADFYGVLGQSAPITINNDGTISGSSAGIRLGSGGTVTQGATGKITSTGSPGIINDNGVTTITNAGTISGALGIVIRGNSNGTITNSGTITGTGGVAINITNTTNNINLILQTGSVINGNVTSAGANTRLELQGSGTANNTFSGFSKIAVQQAGTAWTLGGNVSTTGNSSTLVDVQNGQLNIAGTLTNTGGFNVSNNGTLQVTGTMTNAVASTVANSGTLMIGNGGTTGSTTGNITNDGTIIFNRSSDMTLNGVISGSGSVQKLGFSVLYMDGANTYSGLTTIQVGRIYLNNAQGLGSGGVVLNNAAELLFGTTNGQTASGLFVNAISGAGLVGLTSQANIVLGGNNSNFSGVFGIDSDATLTATATENLGSANIVNNGVMVFSPSANMSYGGTISGVGAVQKLGTEALFLDGINTYTGLTTVQGGGAIYLNNIQGVGTGGIVLSSTTDSLIFDTFNGQTASGVFANEIIGAGTVGLNSQENIVLGSDNSNFSGVFNIGAAATLVATSAENLGTASIVDNGIFQVDAATNWTLANTLTGTGAFVKSGAGQLLVNQIDHSGATTVADGTLLVGSGSTSAMLGLVGSAGLVTVNSDATLSGTGTVNGAVLNLGTIAALNTVDGYTQNAVSNLTLNSALDNSTGTINLAGEAVGNTLTVMGNYTGGGSVYLNAKLDENTSLSDKLIIKGSTSGATNVYIQNKDGSGSESIAGIKMVEVDGASNGSFILSNRVTIGMYDYTLNKENDGSWYLQSQNFPDPAIPDPLIPEIGVALGNQTAAQFMFVHSMYDRMGDLRNGVATIGNGGWVKVSGGRAEFNAGGDVLSQRIDLSRLQFGADIAATQTTNGSWQAGIMGGYAHARTKSNSDNNNYTSTYNTTDASGKVDGYTIGAYATWLQKENAGLYVDSWLQLGRFRNNINGNNQSAYNSTGISASVETGYRFVIGAIGNMAWSVEPQAQVVFSKLNSNDYTASNGMSASDASGSGTMGRLGVRLSGQDVGKGLSPFAELNAWFGRNGADSIKFSDASGERVVSNDIPNTRIQLKAGLQGNLDKNWQVWGDVGTEIGSNDFTSYQGSLGVRYNW